MAEEKKSDSNLMAALSYLWLLSVVMLLLKKEDPFVKFHAKQGLVLAIASIVAGVIPFLGWFLLVPIVIIGEIIGFIMAIQGKEYKLPVIGDLAGKINI